MAIQFAVLDSDFEVVAILDKYESMIWTERAQEAGDFELYTAVSDDLLDKLSLGRYLMCDTFYDRTNETARLMIIEDREIRSDSESGNKLIVTGQDLKSILQRRIVWKQTNVAKDTNVQTAIKTLIDDAIVSPTNTKRTISNFVFDEITGTFGNIKEDAQYVGETLYEVMTDLCENYNLNYEVVVNFNTKEFHMHLVIPKDHTWEQTQNPPVIFSSKFNNLRNASYKNITSTSKNVALIHGEGDEYNMIKADIGSDDNEGLSRREMFVNASDLSQELEDGTIYSEETYRNMLITRGKKSLREVNKDAEVYEGEADNSVSGYIYGKDYDIGDIVEIVNDYNIESKVWVKEMVLSVSTTGETLVPTFETCKDEEEETTP